MKTMYEVGRRETRADYIRKLDVISETNTFITVDHGRGCQRRQKKETSWTVTFQTEDEAIAYVTANAERAIQKRKDGAVRDAAHDLLEALEAVVRVADRDTVEFDMARAAIAKAKGEQP